MAAADSPPDTNPPAGPFAELLDQHALLRQQVGQLYGAVGHLCNQLLQSDAALQQELRNFQVGGLQQAIATLFHKLFRELVGYLAQLDELVGLGDQRERLPAEHSWIESIRVARNRLEALLGDWGCVPVVVAIDDEFDPRVHEAVQPEPGEVKTQESRNRIVKIKRRGWKLHEQVLLQPRVVVH